MMLHAAGLSPSPGVRHAFFTRRGGISDGAWATLNVGLRNGDAPEHVSTNRARCTKALGYAPSSLVTARQVHGTVCLPVDAAWPVDRIPEADGLATRRPGLLLGVLTADCAPVLLADSEAGVIGACHAGWRGALDGIIEATIERMVQLGASATRIAAAIGPCIAQHSYEVGPEFRRRFVGADPCNERFFVRSTHSDRPRFDLKGYLGERLRRSAVSRIEACAEDTCADPVHFFSFRRSKLAGETRFGLQLSAIGLNDEA
jgi:YfiH family protein